MTTAPPPEHLRLQQLLRQLIDYPREDLGVEYKRWLDLREESARATIAKAAIAMANHGGGYVILGFEDQGQNLESKPIPQEIPEITQDTVNSAISRYADPPFHCEVYPQQHSRTGVQHPVISIRGGSVPVLCKRDQDDAAVSQYVIYMRKPGPSSEAVRTAEEWRQLLDRCVRARREDLLDAIRAIVLGQVDPQDAAPEPLEALEEFCQAAHQNWEDLVADEPDSSPARFTHGYYEIGIALLDALPAEGLTDLGDRINAAQALGSAWSPFFTVDTPGHAPYGNGNVVEAWLGRPVQDEWPADVADCDFWRASLDGKLYSIRGYIEDNGFRGAHPDGPGVVFYIDVSVMPVAEALATMMRYTQSFGDIDKLAIRLHFSGLGGRRLAVSNRGPKPRLDYYVSQADTYTIYRIVSLRQIRDNRSELVYDLLKPLYEQFNWYQLPLDTVRDIP